MPSSFAEPLSWRHRCQCTMSTPTLLVACKGSRLFTGCSSLMVSIANTLGKHTDATTQARIQHSHLHYQHMITADVPQYQNIHISRACALTLTCTHSKYSYSSFLFNDTRMTMTSQPNHILSNEKPQDLTETQCHANAGLSLYAPVRMERSGLVDATTREPMFTITREAIHKPSLLSTKPLLTVMRNSTETALGTIRFRYLTTRNIQLNIDGRETVLVSSHVYKHWKFESVSLSDNRVTHWFWKRDESLPHSVILSNSKNIGRIFACIDGVMLIFEEADLGDETFDEIVMTAVALAEHARRHAWNEDSINLGKSIGNYVGGRQRERAGAHQARVHQSRGHQSRGH
jgi:hypothetical protein